MLEAAQSGRISEGEIDASIERIQALKARVAIAESPQLDIVRQSTHLDLMKEAARAGTVLLRADSDVFPIKPAQYQKIAVVEFASYLDSGVVESGGRTGFASLLHMVAPEIETVSLRSVDPNLDAVEKLGNCLERQKLLVLVTRNAHLIPEQLQMARELMRIASRTILICLQNPYDVNELSRCRRQFSVLVEIVRPPCKQQLMHCWVSLCHSGKLPVEVSL